MWQEFQVVQVDAPPVQQQREGTGLRLLLLQPGFVSGSAEVQADQHRVAIAKSAGVADEGSREEPFKGKFQRSPNHICFISDHRALIIDTI